MSKFTSKDLMYAMGLQKGDVVENEYGLTVEIVEDEKGEIRMKRDDMPVKHKLIELVDKDFEIKNKTLRMLSEERSMLKLFSESGFEYIARDYAGVWIYQNDPVLEIIGGEHYYMGNHGDIAQVPGNHFQFIEDKHKYSIDELLKENK